MVSVEYIKLMYFTVFYSQSIFFPYFEAHVWLGKWRNSLEVEIKTVELNKKGAKECLKEMELIRGLRHLNLLNIVGVCTEDRMVHVVTERPFSVELLQYWLKRCGLSALPLHLHILSQVNIFFIFIFFIGLCNNI